MALAPTDATPFAARGGDAVPMQPAINPGRWVTNDDYPPEAMREEREGTTGFRITIDAKGLPADCEIVSSSGHADLDAATCRLVVERARFTPGRDAAGRATGGTYSNRIRWQIPDDHDHPGLHARGLRGDVAAYSRARCQHVRPRSGRPLSGVGPRGSARGHGDDAARHFGERRGDRVQG
ncbi:energy transducer TonB [Sphingopyxis sp.]|uniref:energy transducer TonB n=1 Tax=Sphingopyxis sp. TaxID=1908224 RepID=UPI003D80F589